MTSFSSNLKAGRKLTTICPGSKCAFHGFSILVCVLRTVLCSVFKRGRRGPKSSAARWGGCLELLSWQAICLLFYFPIDVPWKLTAPLSKLPVGASTEQSCHPHISKSSWLMKIPLCWVSQRPLTSSALQNYWLAWLVCDLFLPDMSCFAEIWLILFPL